MNRYYYRFTFNSVSACMLGECHLRQYTALYDLKRDRRSFEVCLLIPFSTYERQEVLDLTRAERIEDITRFSSEN